MPMHMPMHMPMQLPSAKSLPVGAPAHEVARCIRAALRLETFQFQTGPQPKLREGEGGQASSGESSRGSRHPHVREWLLPAKWALSDTLNAMGAHSVCASMRARARGGVKGEGECLCVDEG